MSIFIYRRAQRTCGRACPHAQTHTYTCIHTHKLKHPHLHTHVPGHITLFPVSVDRKLIVGILLIFCWFFCCDETWKSILRLLPWDRNKIQRNPCFPRLNCSFSTIHSSVTLDRHRSTNRCVSLVETRFGHHFEIWNPIKGGPSKCLRAS